MRNEFRLDRVLRSSRSIAVSCCLLFLLTTRISAQIDNETFERAFGLIEPESTENKESLYTESNGNHADVTEKKEPGAPSEVEDLIEGENNHEEETGEEVPPDTDKELKNEPKAEVTISRGIAGRIAEEKTGKYVRYGKSFDIEWA